VRRLSCDQDEFDSPESEQSLELAITSPSRRQPDLAALLIACGASACIGPRPPPGWHRWQTIADHLRRFASVDLPHPTQLREAMLLRDDWDDVELGVAAGSLLIWYHWSMTA
jgi:hypothetical protein